MDLFLQKYSKVTVFCKLAFETLPNYLSNYNEDLVHWLNILITEAMLVITAGSSLSVNPLISPWQLGLMTLWCYFVIIDLNKPFFILLSEPFIFDLRPWVVCSPQNLVHWLNILITKAMLVITDFGSLSVNPLISPWKLGLMTLWHCFVIVDLNKPFMILLPAPFCQNLVLSVKNSLLNLYSLSVVKRPVYRKF